MSDWYYYQRAGELNRTLKKAIPVDMMKALHAKQPIRHFAVALRQFALLLGLPWLIYLVGESLLWLPVSVLLGFVVFSFSVLLHEVIHKCVFTKDRRGWSAFLGYVYGLCSGLAAAQFERWHMDHHQQLGSAEADPKRHYLSPKRHARWYKLLYCTPVLFPIYFKAAAQAAAGYPKDLQRKIRFQRLSVIAIHLSVLGGFAWIDPIFAVRAYVIPVFFVFPIAFTLNRLGQHYVIEPNDIAQWSTLMRPNPLWNFLFIYSSYHLEHHYFPAVPFYKLRALQRALDPFYAEKGVPHYSYSQLVWYWFVRNHKPHTAVGA
ncbi:MAG: fatty acid desaturase [Acidobacteria bacterium]|nr:fatty acid desaturase [Acidobacteriota bacterium]